MTTTSPLVPEIDYRGTRPNSKIIDDIHRRTQKLRLLYQQVLRCRVRLDIPHTRHRTKTQFTVRIELSVPGGTLAITGKPRSDLLSAVQDGFDAAERKVQDHARKRRGKVKIHDVEHMSGIVQQIYPLAGYGFMEAENGDRVYFDQNSVLHDRFKDMHVGQRVRFVPALGRRGPQASSVYV